MNKGSRRVIDFILPNLKPGGAERVITYMCNHLNKDLFQARLVLFQKEGDYLKHLNEDVEVITLNVDRIRNSLWPMIQHIRKEKPDVVFFGWGEIAAYLAPMIPFFKKTKFIARETNVVSEHVKRKEIRFFYRFYNNFHGIIAQSDDMRNDLIKNVGIPQSRITKINNPIDFNFIDQRLRDSSKSVFPQNGNKKVLAVGNLTYRKGFDLLLDVFSRLKQEPIELFILGDGDDREKLLKKKEELELKKVHFLGIQSNPFPFYAQADLFVLSSRYEGFPNVLLEANACGTFALCNDAPGGINEIIQRGTNGEIADIENPDAFSHTLLKAFQKERNPSRIRESVESRYNLETILEQYHQFLVRI